VIGAVRKYLDREYGPLLFYPAYSTPDPRIGYITRYAPGVRENGGVYTHAATWAVMAAAMTGDGDWAYSLYEKICPVLRGRDPDVYLAEPYVTPGNIDGPDSELFGRGGWTWYTGSASWLQRVMNEWILGVRPVLHGLVVRPAIPARWNGFRAKRLFRDRLYDIEVTRGNPLLSVNGEELEPGSPFTGKEKMNSVKVRVQ
jgi:cellobiose phosphorylase